MISDYDKRIISLMVDKINRLIEIVSTHSDKEIESDFVLSDAMQYEFEKLYEDSQRLTEELRTIYGNQIHIDDLRGIRNRVAHDYESVSLTILLDTAKNDLPILKSDLMKLL